MALTSAAMMGSNRPLLPHTYSSHLKETLYSCGAKILMCEDGHTSHGRFGAAADALDPRLFDSLSWLKSRRGRGGQATVVAAPTISP
jgi:hypothetical protein